MIYNERKINDCKIRHVLVARPRLRSARSFSNKVKVITGPGSSTKIMIVDSALVWCRCPPAHAIGV